MKNTLPSLSTALLLTCAVSVSHAAVIDVYQGGSFLGQIESYSGSTTTAANYDLYSNTNHLQIGPALNPEYDHIFFYEGTGGLCFNTIFSSGGSASNISMESQTYTRIAAQAQ